MAYAFNQLSSRSARDLTKDEENDKALLDRELKRYSAAVLRSGNDEWIDNMENTDVIYDPDYVPLSENNVAKGCHNCSGDGRNVITFGPDALNLLNPNREAYEYHGYYFTPGRDGLLEIISHEFGHTFESNQLMGEKFGPGFMVERHASRHVRQLRQYFD